jgi:nucleotide-binding universal stress UspA family protein
MYENILVPTDGSGAVGEAVERAVDLADTYGAKLHALYVIQRIYGIDDEYLTVQSALREQGEDATAAVAATAGESGVECVTKILKGDPAHEIVGYAESNDIDLIVMGTHGRTGLDRMLLGSVAEKVVRHAEIPVLTVRGSEEQTDESDEV